MLRSSGNEKTYETFAGRLDARTKMLISASVSLGVIFLSSPFALLPVAMAGAAYLLSTQRYGVALFVHCLMVVMFLTAYGCVWLIHFTFPASAAPDAMKFTIPFLRTLSVMDAVVVMAVSSRIQDIFSALGRLGLPFWLYMPAAVMIRFIPGFIGEMRDISESVRLRCNGESVVFMLLASPSRALRMFFMPLAVRSLRISDDLGIAAELKGVDSSWRPSGKMSGSSFSTADAAAVAGVFIMLSGAYVLQSVTGTGIFIH